MFRSVLRVAVALFLGYLLVVLLLAGCQRAFVYHPTTAPERELREVAADRGLMPWEDGDGQVTGWRAAGEPASGAPRFVVFHGNAGYALHRARYVEGFQAALPESQPDVRIFEYPGYGARSGRPSESVLKAAALEAVDALLDGTEGALFLVGESLGTGVAAYLAAQRPDDIAGLVLITPFTSLVDVARHHFRFLPVRWVMRERFPNVEALEAYRGPVAFLVAEADEVVPTQLGIDVYEAYDGPRQLWTHVGAGHNTIDMTPHAAWWREVVVFLFEHVPE